MHEEKLNKRKDETEVQEGAIPAYLMDREGVTRAKVCINRFFFFFFGRGADVF